MNDQTERCKKKNKLGLGRVLLRDALWVLVVAKADEFRAELEAGYVSGCTLSCILAAEGAPSYFTAIALTTARFFTLGRLSNCAVDHSAHIRPHYKD